jgi:hypothetical protein
MTKKTKRPDKELLQLAEDIFDGKVFTSAHLNHDQDMIPNVFMVLMLMEPKAMKAFQKAKPHLIYEYINKAGPMAVNGYPIFHSLSFLNKEEAKRMWGYYETIKTKREDARKEILGENNDRLPKAGRGKGRPA